MSKSTKSLVKPEDIAIRVSNVSKTFKLPHEKQTSVKSLFLNVFNGKRTYEKQQVLNGISFEVKKGEFFGVVGRNGSGKSTLLKLLAGIYTPDKGHIQVNGKLVPFIELGVGFNPELSGRENVFLNGALLGFSRKEMLDMYDEIVEFAELEQFMDQKLKNYSSGMQVRLAFSIAIRAKADVLVLDEVLAVGDEAFQRKCFQYFAQLKKEKRTVILVTHSMDSVQQFCTRAILIDKGHRTQIGTPLEIVQKYHELNSSEGTTVDAGRANNSTINTKYVQARMAIKRSSKNIKIDLEVKQAVELENPVLVINIYKNSGEQVYRWASDEKLNKSLDLKEGKRITINLDDIFPVGLFSAGIKIVSEDRSRDYASINNIAGFEVKNTTNHEWDIHWHPKEEFHIKSID